MVLRQDLQTAKPLSVRTAVYSFSRYPSASSAPRTPPSNPMKNNIAHNTKSRSSCGSKQSFHRKRLNEQCQRNCKPQWQCGVSHLKRCSNSEKSTSPQSGKITDGFLAGMYMIQAGGAEEWEESNTDGALQAEAQRHGPGWTLAGAKAPHKNTGRWGVEVSGLPDWRLWMPDWRV